MNEREGSVAMSGVRRRRGAAIAALVALSWPAAGLAQSDKNKQDSPGDQIQGPLAEELREYWSVERDLAMVREKLYERKGRFAVGLYGGFLPSEPFFNYVPVGGRVGYFLTDEMGIELGGQYELGFPTELTSFLQEDRGDGFDPSTDAGDQFVWRANAVFSWRPLYGKWALLQRKLSHFDLSLAAGVGALGIQRPTPTRDGAESQVTFSGVIGAGMHFFITDGLTVRLDWRSHPYIGPEFETSEAFEEEGGEGRFEVPTEFQLGLSYMF